MSWYWMVYWTAIAALVCLFGCLEHISNWAIPDCDKNHGQQYHSKQKAHSGTIEDPAGNLRADICCIAVGQLLCSHWPGNQRGYDLMRGIGNLVCTDGCHGQNYTSKEIHLGHVLCFCFNLQADNSIYTRYVKHYLRSYDLPTKKAPYRCFCFANH